MLSMSGYSTMLFTQELMRKGKYEAAKEGLDELVAFTTATEKREISKALADLMELIIVWNEIFKKS